MNTRNIVSLLLAGAAWVAVAAQAASTINYSDQWYEGNGGGWGASIQQQQDVLFVAIFVYDTDRSPTWFTATAYPQGHSPAGHAVYSGDLYLTNGTYYGDPNAWMDVAYSKVGTLTFDATTANVATLTCNVGATQVIKGITRQTWKYENLTGTYVGAWHWNCAADTGYAGDWWNTLYINHDAQSQAITIRADDVPPPPFGYFLLAGTYSQDGHLGRVVADLQSTDHGTVIFSEIERSDAGFTAHMSGTINGCQVTNGRVAAVRQ